MRVIEILKEAEQNIFVIGDSIAVGIQQAGGAQGDSEGGKDTSVILGKVKSFVQSGKAKGATVILSSGASNSTYERPNGGEKRNFEIGPVEAQLSVLKDAGATVYLVGTGSGTSPWITNQYGTYRINFKDQNINQQLASAASKYGAKFLGPLEDYDPGMSSGKGDGIHPYSGYSKLFQAGASGANIAPNKAEKGQGGKADASAGKSGTFSIDVPTSRTSPAVADVQKALVALGYDVGPMGVDGIRGPYTSAAVKKFQADNKLRVDGDPGEETVGALNKILISKPDLANKLTKSTTADVKIGHDRPSVPIKFDAVTKGRVGELLNFVAGPESGGYYDMMNGGQRKPEILKMTLNQANAFQLKYAKETGNSSAMGRYQIMHFNILPYASKIGLNPDTDLFSPENQDKYAIEFMKEKGLGSWLAGQMDDKTFLNGLAGVWAGIPNSTGKSTYDGVGNNKAGFGTELAMNNLNRIRTA